MIARVVFENSTLTLLRAAALGIPAFVGAWDVGRLLASGERAPSAFDLATCPILPLMQVVIARVAISDSLLAWTLFVGNAATYAVLGYFLVSVLLQWMSGENNRQPDAS